MSSFRLLVICINSILSHIKKFMNNLSLTPAATVLLVRDCGDELEVLMVKRSKRPPFGNLYVFPGGKIDESDKDLNITNFLQ